MNASSISISVRVEHWPIAGTFAISRGAKTEAAVVVAELFDGRCRGRGECVPYARYDETAAGVRDAIAAMGPDIAAGLDRMGLQQALPPGAAYAGLTARTIAPCIPSATSWVNATLMPANPAAARPRSYSVTLNAPAMHPA